MFSGIVEEVGTINGITSIAGGKKLRIKSKKVIGDLKVSDSVCVSGVCLTAVELEANAFLAEAVGDTLAKTTLADIKKGQHVNLERALRLNDRLGGHFVQGHVNGVGHVQRFRQVGENWDLELSMDQKLMRYIVSEGSIAIDGVSLTVAGLTENTIRISVIPHTYKNTIMVNYRPGSAVNVETDFLGKYVEKFINYKKGESKISDSWLKEMGY